MAIESRPSREGNTAAQGGAPAVALESVVKRFGDVVAVDRIDLEIADGEFFSTLEEASMDLGADTWQTFHRVFLPSIRTALLSGGLLAFALSFDEVIVTNFTAGAGVDTVPLWVLSAIQRPRDLPVVNVVALVLIVLSIIPVYLAQRISNDAGGGGRY